MAIGAENALFNQWPLWVWARLGYKENGAKTRVTFGSAVYKVPDNTTNTTSSFNPEAETETSEPTQLTAKMPKSGRHYCKLLSPLRAMEWVYVDSLFAQNTIQSRDSVNSEEIEGAVEELSFVS